MRMNREDLMFGVWQGGTMIGGAPLANDIFLHPRLQTLGLA